MSNKTIIILILIILLLSACVKNEPAAVSTMHTVYLPMVTNNHVNPLRFGVEIEHGDFQNYAVWYRGDFLTVSWHMADDISVLADKVNGFSGDVFLKFRGVPAHWVTPTCLPIPRQFWDGWLQNAEQAVILTGARWVEIGNEPDTDATWAEKYFGCWGVDYASGVYYGEFVSYTAPRLRARFPGLTIYAGALMNGPGEFAAGFRDTVTGIDGITFHNYPRCGQDAAVSTTTRHQAQADFFAPRPVYLSETSLIYAEWSAECDQEQAEYTRWLLEDYAGTFAIFYTLANNDWMNSDMVKGTPKPAWYVYQERITR